MKFWPKLGILYIIGNIAFLLTKWIASHYIIKSLVFPISLVAELIVMSIALVVIEKKFKSKNKDDQMLD